MRSNKAKIILILSSLIFGILFSSKLVNASSAVAYGTKSIYSSANHENVIDAVKTVLENCSKTDNHCVLVLKCEEYGFGATFSERVEGLITSVGASCGKETAEVAKQQALDNCLQNNIKSNCVLRTFWEDKIN